MIGKNDRGEIVGVRDPLRLLEEIPNKVLSPAGHRCDVDLKSETDGDYIEIRVDPCPNPISHKGEYHYRSGSTKQVLRGAALNQFCSASMAATGMMRPCRASGWRIWTAERWTEFRRRGVSSGRPSA